MLPGLFLPPREPRPVFGPGGRLSPFRAPFEFYPSPPEAVRALLSAERFEGSIWEPACGAGAISKEFERAGYDVVSTDLVDHGFGRPGVDFLTQRLPRARNIVTNPPYGRGLGDAFVRKALSFTRETGGTVAMLLNIASLCHPDRHPSFVRRPPARIYALDQCVCWPNGDPKQATRHTLAHRYAWLIWEPETEAPITTELRWLSTGGFYRRRHCKAQRSIKKETIMSPVIDQTIKLNNDDRARRAAHALQAYRDYTGDSPTSPDEDVIDLLTDLRHYSDRHDLDLGNCDRIAHAQYLEGLTEEKAGQR